MKDPTFADFLAAAEHLLDDLSRAEPRERFVALEQRLRNALTRVRAARNRIAQLHRLQQGVREAVEEVLRVEREGATAQADIRAFAAASEQRAEANAEMARAAQELADAMERASAALRERTR